MGSSKYRSKSDRLAAVVKKEAEEEMNLIPYHQNRSIIPYQDPEKYENLAPDKLIQKIRENAANQNHWILNLQQKDITDADKEDINNRNPLYDHKKSSEPGIRAGEAAIYLTKSLDELADEEEGVIDFS